MFKFRLLNLYNAIPDNSAIKGELFELLVEIAFDSNKMQAISHLTQNVQHLFKVYNYAEDKQQQIYQKLIDSSEA